jgi:carbohydrate kinase (thermoresistant glucokinase family)
MSSQVLIIGLAGSGKSTVGTLLADRLGLRYVDGDLLHPQANLEKMAKGTPLSDENRDQWVANILAELEIGDVVIGASLLKRPYRELINKTISRVHFVQLYAPKSVLEERLDAQVGEFSRKALLDSQIAIFDTLQIHEPGFIVDATLPVEAIVRKIVTEVKAD